MDGRNDSYQYQMGNGGANDDFKSPTTLRSIRERKSNVEITPPPHHGSPSRII